MEEKEAVQKLVAMMVAGKEVSEDEVNTLEAVLLNVSGKLKGELKSDFYDTLKDRISASGSDLFVGNTINVDGIKEIADKTAKEVIEIQKRTEAAKPENYIEQSMARAREEALRENQDEPLVHRIEEINRYFDMNRERIALDTYTTIQSLVYGALKEEGIELSDFDKKAIEEVMKETSMESVKYLKYAQCLVEARNRGMTEEEAQRFAMKEANLTPEQLQTEEAKDAIAAATLELNEQIEELEKDESAERENGNPTEQISTERKQLTELRDTMEGMMDETLRRQYEENKKTGKKGTFFLLRMLDRKERMKEGTLTDATNIVVYKSRATEREDALKTSLDINKIEQYLIEKENIENEIVILQDNIAGRENYCEDKEIAEVAFRDQKRLNAVLDYAMEKYFTTGMSLSQIYENIKKNNPNEEIYFKDMRDKLEECLIDRCVKTGRIEYKQDIKNNASVESILNKEDAIRKKSIKSKAISIYQSNSRDAGIEAVANMDTIELNKRKKELDDNIVSDEYGTTWGIKSRFAEDLGYKIDQSITDHKHKNDFEEWMNNHESKGGQEINPELLGSKFGVEEIHVDGEDKENNKGKWAQLFGISFKKDRSLKDRMLSLKSLVFRRTITKAALKIQLDKLKKDKNKTKDVTNEGHEVTKAEERDDASNQIIEDDVK